MSTRTKKSAATAAAPAAGIEEFKAAFLRRVEMTVAKDLRDCNRHDLYNALAYATRDMQVANWKKTREDQLKAQAKRVYYISLEFLMGRTLGNALINCGLFACAEESLQSLGITLEHLLDEERDAGLGNGGLGRLAACFIDSCAALDLPAYGCGIRYDYGIFRQKIENGFQVEQPDAWLRDGNPWEIVRPERKRVVRFYGHVEHYTDKNGKTWSSWTNTNDVLAMPYDTPVPGYATSTVNTLRLWSARALYDFNLSDFNRGDYISANLNRSLTENITRVLYPNDNNYEGKELRLKQQYFLCAATLADMMEDFKRYNLPLAQLPDKAVIQLNDTHPAVAIPELMRLLIDQEGLEWNEAWDIVTRTFAYTNHTLMAEALEKWPVALFEKLLPRHLQIIYQINYHFLRAVANAYPGDNNKIRDMSIIEEGGEKKVRMAYLCIVGSFSVNGVAALHTELLKHGLVKDFYQFFPAKFNNKTNGITPRRWLLKCNSGLSELIRSRIGDGFTRDLDQLSQLRGFASDEDFQRVWSGVKHGNKERLAVYIKRHMGVQVNPEALFDIQIKRIHEYKRQLMNAFHAIHLYLQIKNDPQADWQPRVILLAGKAAPGYFMAKLIIRFVNAIAAVVNSDPQVKKHLQVLFLPNYSVSMAEVLIPAADLSEQISTAGMEASGTGNMKFALNGALTIGTLDGANVEIKDAVGDENIYIFGLTVEEISARLAQGYRADELLVAGHPLKAVFDLVDSGFFCPEQPSLFKPLLDSVRLHGDRYMLAADFEAYVAAQQRAGADFASRHQEWTRRAILNVAGMGFFSSDRTIRQYADEIWKIKSLY